MGLCPIFSSFDFVSIPEVIEFQRTHVHGIVPQGVTLVLAGDSGMGKSRLAAAILEHLSSKDKVLFGNDTTAYKKFLPGWHEAVLLDDFVGRGVAQNTETVAQISDAEVLSVVNVLSEQSVRYVGGAVQRPAYITQIITVNLKRLLMFHLTDEAISRRTCLVLVMHPEKAIRFVKKNPSYGKFLEFPKQHDVRDLINEQRARDLPKEYARLKSSEKLFEL